MRIRILIKKDTGELDGVTTCSVDADIEHVQVTATHDVMDVRPDHAAIHEQLDWEAPRKIILGAQWNRELKKKPVRILPQEPPQRPNRIGERR